MLFCTMFSCSVTNEIIISVPLISMSLSCMKRAAKLRYAALAHGRFCSILVAARKTQFNSITSVPAPRGALPLLGHLIPLFKNRTRLPLLAHELFDELGPIV